ncbi:MAG: TIGR01548 family HAD-type hydrolase [Candidatus Aminicenantes bacterium]|nr:TIGR01548 family HAD-type hydrolase [Candidatus Aminicenantes bacterium]
MTAVLFDMDGVLVDVSQSYLVTIQKTVEFFLGNPIDLPEIREYKNRGGMNNDWDLTEVVLRERGKPVPQKEIIDVFQDIYLGKSFDGLIRNEKWLMHRDLLDQMTASYPTGIVTGRPKMEATYVLNRFDVKDCFSVLITMDDVPADKNKPDPYGIILAMQRLSASSAYYIGDTVDDMVAAKKAGAIPIGVVSSGNDPKTQEDVLLRSGASRVLRSVNDIAEVIS